MGLFQVVTVSVKKGTVLSTLRGLLHLLLLSLGHIYVHKWKLNKSKAQPAGVQEPSFSAYPPAREMFSSLSQHRCGFTLGLR